MQTHKIIPKSKKIEKAFDLINDYLPPRYMKYVREKLGDKYSPSLVKQVRNRTLTNYKSPTTIEIVNTLAEVAKKNKQNIESLSEAV